MATTQDMRYERNSTAEDSNRSPARWLIPLAIIVLAALAWAWYAASQKIITMGTTNTNGSQSSGLQSDLNNLGTPAQQNTTSQ
jgi:hypothetical protein